VEALRAGRRLGELAEASGMPLDEITRVIYALSVIGAVGPADGLPRLPAGTMPAMTAAAPPVTAVKPAAPSTTSIPAVSPEAERRRNEVMQAYLSFRRQDSFDLLGAPEDAPLTVIQERYLDFARRFSPWSGGSELAGMEEKVQDLFLAGARAYAELADSEQRNTLIFRRKTLREERAKKPQMAAIKTDLLDSALQFKKGQALLEAGKYREALQLLEFASDCEPQNSLYRAEMAWCRFLQSPSLPNQPVRELEETLKRDPRCGLAAYYLGEVLRQSGRFAEAEEPLQRAIKLMSPDRRPIEALKALSAEKKR
jgi:tetratricopeptide (TPR) repeat protein